VQYLHFFPYFLSTRVVTCALERDSSRPPARVEERRYHLNDDAFRTSSKPEEEEEEEEAHRRRL